MSRMTEKAREPGANFDITYPDNMPEVYVDGISKTLSGPLISKIVFHRVVVTATSTESEQRVAAATIVIPTQALIEYVANIGASFANNTPSLLAAHAQLGSALNQILEAHKNSKPLTPITSAVAAKKSKKIKSTSSRK
ncbi:MAG: hypothetical protein V4607_01825 [Pseudomonadota bacterium]